MHGFDYCHIHCPTSRPLYEFLKENSVLFAAFVGGALADNISSDLYKTAKANILERAETPNDEYHIIQNGGIHIKALCEEDRDESDILGICKTLCSKYGVIFQSYELYRDRETFTDSMRSDKRSYAIIATPFSDDWHLLVNNIRKNDVIKKIKGRYIFLVSLTTETGRRDQLLDLFVYHIAVQFSERHSIGSGNQVSSNVSFSIVNFLMSSTWPMQNRMPGF